MTREKNLDPSTREQAAQAWETFHGTEEASATEHREFGAWAMRSPEHIEAYLRVARTMQAMKSKDIRWPNTSAEELIREAKAHTGQVVTTLRDLGASKLLPVEQDLVREAADTLLFCADPGADESANDAVATIEAVAANLVESGRWTTERAASLVDDVLACGLLTVARADAA